MAIRLPFRSREMASGREWLHDRHSIRGRLQATLGSVLVITADIREERAGVPFLLEQLGVTVDPDCACRPGTTSADPSTVVERKSVDDLHKTIAAGRFWPQMGRIRECRSVAVLDHRGRDARCAGRSTRMRFAGLCLAAADLGNRGHPNRRRVMTAPAGSFVSRDDVRRAESATARRTRNGRSRPRVIPPAEAALAAAPGISVVDRALAARARSALSRRSSSPTPEAWQDVPGVGSDNGPRHSVR